MSRKFARKAVYYRKTDGGRTKWVKIPDAKFVEYQQRLELTNYRNLSPRQTFRNPRTYVREEA
jgi:hypothetical protein